ncbi:MAG: beta-glucosidase, partial [Meiothermus silvanus]|nr:beta-glucosidase [Allomeiothermus silvanus]
VYGRYRRPLFVAETGAENEARAPWLAYVAGEVQAAIKAGIPVEGICLYPVADYPAWDDGRRCRVGLLGYPDPQGQRPVYPPLAQELAWQQGLLQPVLAP